MKFTITRALSKLKSLKNEYQAALRDVKVVGVKQGSKMYGNYVSYREQDFIDQVTSKNQSLQDMERLILEIKYKIDQSNSTTIVKIGEKEMTIQEAIVYKNMLPLKKQYLQTLKESMRRARLDYENALLNNKDRVQRLVSDQQSGGFKKEDLEEDAYNSIEKLYKVDYVDPLKAESLIEKIEKEIVEFETNVDYVLSESNSTTYIEINC